jgi:hypothetical protein
MFEGHCKMVRTQKQDNSDFHMPSFDFCFFHSCTKCYLIFSICWGNIEQNNIDFQKMVLSSAKGVYTCI